VEFGATPNSRDAMIEVVMMVADNLEQGFTLPPHGDNREKVHVHLRARFKHFCPCIPKAMAFVSV
jgi:hypothetical protein